MCLDGETEFNIVPGVKGQKFALDPKETERILKELQKSREEQGGIIEESGHLVFGS